MFCIFCKIQYKNKTGLILIFDSYVEYKIVSKILHKGNDKFMETNHYYFCAFLLILFELDMIAHFL